MRNCTRQKIRHLVRTVTALAIVGVSRSQGSVEVAHAQGRGTSPPDGRASRVVIVGRVTDSISGTPVRVPTIEVKYQDIDSLLVTAASDDSGRFAVLVPRRGVVRLTVRRPGYEPFGRQVVLTSDTVRLTIALRRIAQPLSPIVVEQTEVDLVLREMRRELRSENRIRIYDQKAMAKSGQLLTGPFLLGQAGIVRVPCRRSAQFLPPGKVRTQPVEHEPADPYWPCVMRRDKPVSVLVSIDNGPPGEFNAINGRQLEEFAMVVVSHGQFVRAYTKQFVENRALARRSDRQ